MQLNDLLVVLREEFETAAADIDEHLGNWLGDEPSQAALHCEPLVEALNRLASTVRMVGMQGFAVALEMTRDAAQVLALSDDTAMAGQLPWLMLWRDPFANALAHPAQQDSSDILTEYLTAGPLPLSPDLLSELGKLLMIPPALEQDEGEDSRFAEPSFDDVSLELPPELDLGLFESFLSDAPRQLAKMGESVHRLAQAQDPLSISELEEVQRVAHTFKGSGNIMGVRGIGQLAHRMEDMLEFAQRQGGTLPAPMAHDLEQACATLDQMIYALRGEESAPEPALALSQLGTLVQWARAIENGSWTGLLDQQTSTPPRIVAVEAEVLAETQTQGDAGVEAAAKSEAVHEQAVEPAPTELDFNLEEPATAPSRAALTTDRVALRVPLTQKADESQEPEAEIRVGSARLSRLVRRAGQALVQHSRQAERLKQIEARLNAAEASHEALQQRLRQLDLQLERQGVSLHERAASSGFDALEFDRYSELQSLARFVTELAADSQELTQQARNEGRQLMLALPDQERNLKAAHRELLGARLLPFRTVVARLRRNVVQTAAATGKRARLELQGDDVMLDSDVLEALTEPLLHLLRNAVDHGIETPDERELMGKPADGLLRLTLRTEGPLVHLECADDGRGLDLVGIERKALKLGLIKAPVPNDQLARLILLPGFSTREQVNDISGRGIGMDVVAQRLRALKGEIDISTEPLRGTRFQLRLPSSLGSVQALVVEISGERFALPVENVRLGVAASLGERSDSQLVLDGQTWPLRPLADLLDLGEQPEAAGIARPAVILRSGRDELALLVDRVVETRELILQEPGKLLRRLPLVGGGALRADGRVLMLLDVGGLVARHNGTGADRQALTRLRRRTQTPRRSVLVVDDSLSVRKGLSQLMLDAGFDVRAARDGFDALQLLNQSTAELVLTDLEMPNLNGLELTRALRADPRWAALPVVMLTSRSTDKHRTSAAEAGVNTYLTKPYTDEDLMARVRALLPA
jgi:chemotaxis protein histidine kinase CheA